MKHSIAKKSSTLKQRVIVLIVLVAVLWGVEAIDWLLKGRLNYYGVRPRDIDGLWGILFMPFLHNGWHHLAANSTALMVFSWLVLLHGVREYVEVSIVIVLIGGFGTWLFGQPNTIHVGASGLIFGYFGFLIVRALIDFQLKSLIGGLVAGLLYGGLFLSLFATQPNVSWAGHAFGFLAGCFTAWVLVRYGKN